MQTNYLLNIMIYDIIVREQLEENDLDKTILYIENAILQE